MFMNTWNLIVIFRMICRILKLLASSFSIQILKINIQMRIKKVGKWELFECMCMSFLFISIYRLFSHTYKLLSFSLKFIYVHVENERRLCVCVTFSLFTLYFAHIQTTLFSSLFSDFFELTFFLNSSQ